MDIRLARPEDTGALNQLIVMAARALSQGFYTPPQAESAITHIFGVDSQLVADGTYFIVERHGVLTGCGGWSKRRTLYGGDQMKLGPDPLLDPLREAARIRAFFVHPAWARQGIGRCIIDACEAAARAEGFTRMELVATLPGEPLYRACGYAVTERFEIALPDGIQLPVARMGRAIG
jgi:GNAT superfamily N-acetyltransferase